MTKTTKLFAGILGAAYIAGMGGLYLQLADTREKLANYQINVAEKYVQQAAFLSDDEAAELDTWRAKNPNETRLDIRGRYISPAAISAMIQNQLPEAIFLRQLAERTRPNS